MIGRLVNSIAGAVSGLTTARGLPPHPPSSSATISLYGTIALQATLLWGARHSARAATQGDLSACLANRPVSRRGLITLLAFLLLLWDGIVIATLTWIIEHGGRPPVVPAQLGRIPPDVSMAVVHIALLTVIAPVAEELFFRGWLWTALAKSWSPSRTFCWTSFLWAAMHLLDGTLRLWILLPTSILLGLARHYGGSVRASLALHIMNNSLVVLLQLATMMTSTNAG